MQFPEYSAASRLSIASGKMKLSLGSMFGLLLPFVSQFLWLYGFTLSQAPSHTPHLLHHASISYMFGSSRCPRGCCSSNPRKKQNFLWPEAIDDLRTVDHGAYFLSPDSAHQIREKQPGCANGQCQTGCRWLQDQVSWDRMGRGRSQMPLMASPLLWGGWQRHNWLRLKPIGPAGENEGHEAQDLGTPPQLFSFYNL